ncbi:MAG: ribonuclease HI [Clostridiales bacterium]|jgi:ribonuclease HI|nr:ribonuclease HI [Clostridiales bacterium]
MYRIVFHIYILYNLDENMNLNKANHIKANRISTPQSQKGLEFNIMYKKNSENSPNTSNTNKKLKRVKMYTDGACSGNPGPGGYCAILIYNEHEKVISGGEADTTNNRMELMGAIAGLEALREPCSVDLYSDSKYLVDGISKGWAASWKRRGWIKSDKKPALNPDLWDRILHLLEVHDVTLHWVKGHSDNKYNNRCDEVAVSESLKYAKINNDV